MRFFDMSRLTAAGTTPRTAPVAAHRRRAGVVLALAGALLAGAGAGSARAQLPVGHAAATHDAPVGTLRAAAGLATVPFEVGERLEYDAKVGPFRVGSGHMEVVGLEDVRGRDALRVNFRVSGRALGFKVRDVMDSWIDPRTLSSVRFRQELLEGSKTRNRAYEIFPERATWAEEGKPEERGVSRPLDDGAFFYYVRTLPLEVGHTYTLANYFRPDRNPVTVRVLGIERVKVPAGTFEAIVVQPSIKTRGLLSESAGTRLWLSNDSRRILLKMESGLPFGSLSLHLKKVADVRL